MRQLVIATYLIMWCAPLRAQQKSLKYNTLNDSVAINKLDSVAIYSKGIADDHQLISQLLLTVNPSQTFAEALQKQSGIFVRSKGYGALSTPTYKGLGTMHIPIFINGVNVQSSSNGTMDLSLIDAIHFNKIQFSSQTYNVLGSQALGDAVSLESNRSQPMIDVNLSYGSLRECALSAKTQVSRDRFSYWLSVAGVNSDNKVSLSHYGIDSLLINTALRRMSAMQRIEYVLNSKSIIWSDLFYVSADREIPPAIGEYQLNRQQDLNVFHVTTYQYQFNNHSLLSVRNQVSREQIGFYQDLNQTNTLNTVHNVNTNASLKNRVSKFWLVEILGNHQRALYRSEGIREPASWNRTGGSYSIKRLGKKSLLNLTQGFVFWNNKLYTRANIQALLRFHPNRSFQIRVQKVYRLPVLNELFWYQPGRALGNPDLLAEQGYKLDLNFEHTGNKFRFRINPHVGFFDNWVQWGGFPEIIPVNVNRVTITGAIINSSFIHSLQGIKVLVQHNLHYVRSLYQLKDQQDTRHQKQLIFTPSWTSNFTISLTHKDYGIYSNTQFVGKNYFTSDNSTFLDPYLTVDFGGFYSFGQIRLGCSATNIFDQAYYTQPRTPLPGRVFRITLNYQLNFKHKKI